MTALCKLAMKWRCDKAPSIRHSYTPYYHELLHSRTIKRVLEIGIYEGASLRMWKDYFPSAEIFGIDNDRKRLFYEDRIFTILGDQSSEADLHYVASFLGGSFDLIVDDGSHWAEHQIISVNALMPFVNDGGLYVIEDVANAEYVSSRLPFPPEIKRFSALPDDCLIIIRKGTNVQRRNLPL